MNFLQASGRPLIMDGAMGTQLIDLGLAIRSDIAERWVLERSSEVEAVHRAYARAGAEAIQTCTFGALRSRLAPFQLESRVREICAIAVRLARSGAPGLPLMGSLGPTGLALSAALSANDSARITEEVAEAAGVLASYGVDAIHLETQYSPSELVAAAAGARIGAPTTPLFISITLMVGSTGLETPHGVPVDRMLRALAAAAPDAIGVNCSLDAERIRDAVERLVASQLGPVLVRPQARVSEKCATGRSSESPTRFAERAAALFDVGAAAVGGCCGTEPASIAALVSKIHGLSAEAAQREVAR